MNIKELLIPKWLRFSIGTVRAQQRVLMLHPLALAILGHMSHYCLDNELPFVVTDTVSTLKEDQSINRGHATHRQGRAFDISVKGWDELDIRGFVEFFNEQWKSVAAISSETGEPTLVIDHVGTARHLHVQINARFKLPKFEIVEGYDAL